jgi:CheY-like chemotaxis protein
MNYKNILIIDDDQDDQEIFIAAVNEISESITCHAISNASHALDQLTAFQLKPEIIFLDLNMPVMNGQEFLVALKKSKGIDNIPVIIFSTTSHPATISLMKELGAIDFITKPPSYDELIKLLTPILS